MDDASFSALAALALLAGIALLALPSVAAPEPAADVASLAGLDSGSRVSVAGEVSRASVFAGTVRFSLCTGDCISVIIFPSAAAQGSTHASNAYAIKNGMRVRVDGELQEYRGTRNLVVSGFEVLG